MERIVSALHSKCNKKLASLVKRACSGFSGALLFGNTETLRILSRALLHIGFYGLYRYRSSDHSIVTFGNRKSYVWVSDLTGHNRLHFRCYVISWDSVLTA
jgi:hypothetical protein